jgi:predicted DCC family thiol-disulfide oxidoreductase YuxK
LAPPATDIVFYDGHCALCHFAVQFVLKHEPRGATQPAHFAPLQGETFRTLVPPEQRAAFPDSMVVRTASGEWLVCSDAAIYILKRLRGTWPRVASILAVIPRPLRDLGYNVVAAIRYRVFGRRDDVCPVVPPELRSRFEP